MKFSRLSTAISPLGSGLIAMNCFGFGATLSALFRLGAGGQPTMGSADVFSFDSWRFTLEPRAFAHCLTLFTLNSTTSGQHC
jgi:hypothetical protein